MLNRRTAGAVDTVTVGQDIMEDDEPNTATPLLEQKDGGPMASPPVDPCVAAMGDFGRWQLRAVLIVALVKIPSAWQMASILFTAPTPVAGEFWCEIPTGKQDWDLQRWREFSQPPVLTENQTLDACNMYIGAYNATELITRVLDNETTACTDFEFNPDKVTVVSMWTLVCKRWILVSVSQFFYLFGILVGGFLCAKLLARVSPRRLILAGMIVQVLAGAGVAYSPYFELMAALRFVTAASCAVMFTSGYVICTDICNGRWRLVIACCYEHFWSIGVIILPFLASCFKDWRHLQLAISIPTIIILTCFHWIPDSPRWLITHGHISEAQIVLDVAAKVNGTRAPVIEIPIDKRNATAAVATTKWTQLFASSTDRWRCIAMHLAWGATVVTYYGGLLNVRNLGGDMHFNTWIAGLAEIAGVLLGLLLILWASKRKWLYLGVILLLGGTACLLCWLLPNAEVGALHYGLLLGLAMIGRISIACSLTLLHVTSAEILPPGHRVIGVLSSVTFARFCLLTAPFIGYLSKFGNYVSLSAFGVITIIGGLSVVYIALTTLQSGIKIPIPNQGGANITNIWSVSKNTIAFNSKELPISTMELVEPTKYYKHNQDTIN